MGVLLFCVVFGGLCFGFGWFPVFVCCLLQLDSWMDYVKVRTRSLLQSSYATALHASHNSFSASTNLWNDLAKAIKASDGKNNTAFHLLPLPKAQMRKNVSEPYPT